MTHTKCKRIKGFVKGLRDGYKEAFDCVAAGRVKGLRAKNVIANSFYTSMRSVAEHLCNLALGCANPFAVGGEESFNLLIFV